MFIGKAIPAAKPFKEALVEDGIPTTTFGVEDLQAEYERLCQLGVQFTQPPVAMGPVSTAVGGAENSRFRTSDVTYH